RIYRLRRHLRRSLWGIVGHIVRRGRKDNGRDSVRVCCLCACFRHGCSLCTLIEQRAADTVGFRLCWLRKFRERFSVDRNNPSVGSLGAVIAEPEHDVAVIGKRKMTLQCKITVWGAQQEVSVCILADDGAGYGNGFTDILRQLYDAGGSLNLRR